MSDLEQSDRDIWSISRQSFHYRLYLTWDRFSLKSPVRIGRRINLCHYMRVVMIWVWFRLFFQQNIVYGITPFLATLSAACVSAAVYMTVTYPHEMAQVWFWVFLSFAVTILLAAAVAILIGWHDRSYRTFMTMVNGLEWPFIKIGHGAGWLWDRALHPALVVIGRVLGRYGYWFVNKKVWKISLWWFLPPAVVAFTFWLNINAGIIMVGVIAGFALAAGVLAGMVLLIERVINPWRSRRSDARDRQITTEPQPPSQFREFTRLIWQYLTAKKKKICPFIIPVDGRTTD